MILVTGASGTVGSQVVKQLSAAGAKFRVLYRDRKEQAPAGVEAVVGDFKDRGQMRSALRGVERMFLLCGPVPELAELESSAIDAARESGVKHIAKLSVVGAEKGEHTFARPHQKSEQKLRASKMAWTILRCNGFMQNFLQYAGSINSQNAFYAAGEKAKASWVDVRDIAAVAAKALTADGHAGKTYTLTGPEALSYGDIAKKLSAALGREVRYVAVTPEQARAGMLQAGVPAYIADAVLDLQRFYDAGKGAVVSQDVERVSGRRPASFDLFARDFAHVFKPAAAAAS